MGSGPFPTRLWKLLCNLYKHCDITERGKASTVPAKRGPVDALGSVVDPRDLPRSAATCVSCDRCRKSCRVWPLRDRPRGSLAVGTRYRGIVPRSGPAIVSYFRAIVEDVVSYYVDQNIVDCTDRFGAIGAEPFRKGI